MSMLHKGHDHGRGPLIPPGTVRLGYLSAAFSVRKAIQKHRQVDMNRGVSRPVITRHGKAHYQIL